MSLNRPKHVVMAPQNRFIPFFVSEAILPGKKVNRAGQELGILLTEAVLCTHQVGALSRQWELVPIAIPVAVNLRNNVSM